MRAVAVKYVGVGGALFALGCGALTVRAPRITPTIAAAGLAHGADAPTLEHGRVIYVSACVRCHAQPDVHDHAAGEWPQILADMTHKARLDLGSAESVAAYVLACVEAGSEERAR